MEETRTHKLGTLTFRKVSAAYIDVAYNGNVTDCINIYDYRTGKTTVRYNADLTARVDQYMEDDQNIRDHFNNL